MCAINEINGAIGECTWTKSFVLIGTVSKFFKIPQVMFPLALNII